MFCNLLLPSSCPLSIFRLLFINNNYKSNRVKSRKVKSTILCHFKNWWERIVLPPSVLLTTDVLLKSDLNILQYCTTAVLTHQRAGAHLWTRVWYHPDLLLQPTVRHHVFNSQSVDRSDTLLVLASWSLIWKHCRAAERHWKADQSHITAELDLTSSPAGVWVSMWFFWPSKMDVYWEPCKAPHTPLCVSMCLHSVKCAQHTWKHTRKWCQKERKK